MKVLENSLNTPEWYEFMKFLEYFNPSSIHDFMDFFESDILKFSSKLSFFFFFDFLNHKRINCGYKWKNSDFSEWHMPFSFWLYVSNKGTKLLKTTNRVECDLLTFYGNCSIFCVHFKFKHYFCSKITEKICAKICSNDTNFLIQNCLFLSGATWINKKLAVNAFGF
jgi:hypothetical protein